MRWFFPAAFQRQVAADRLGVTASVLPGGHLMALSRPEPLAGYLLSVDQLVSPDFTVDIAPHQLRVADIANYDEVYKRLIRSMKLTDVSAAFVMEEIKQTTALPLHGSTR